MKGQGAGVRNQLRDRSARMGRPTIAAVNITHATPARSGRLHVIMTTTNERPPAKIFVTTPASVTRSRLRAVATTTALILFAAGVLPTATLAQITYQPEKKPPATPAPAPDQGPMQV
ncbi:MAG: hypothetical protein IBJ18_12705, partial [Phycisphaerales bacterium]|nr:hypothetical protein [Phycisphaerales bacterium]